mgnify:CR=1 FL=1|tara:strand:- start:119 stop:346 length:228 start_codon:yes stop_codon:yes gene_type:complete
MTDQTRWGIPELHRKNKMKAKKIMEDRGEGDLTLQIEKLKEEIENLKAELAREKEDRQYDNLVHKKELKELYKKK